MRLVMEYKGVKGQVRSAEVESEQGQVAYRIPKAPHADGSGAGTGVAAATAELSPEQVSKREQHASPLKPLSTADAKAVTPRRQIAAASGHRAGGVADERSFAEQKAAAICRGLDFLQTMGEALLRNENLATRHGADVLLPFYIPPPRMTATPEERHAYKVAIRLASEWRARTTKGFRHLPPRVPPEELLDLMQGVYSLECLGLSEPSLRAQLLERCAAWGAADFFKYDPTQGEPPKGLREACMCGARPPAGSSHCPSCRRPTIPMSRFDVWLEALVWSFHGCRMRIGLGACFFDVLRQVCGAFAALYPQRDKLREKDKHYLTYAITHVIYALNNFDERSLPPSLFPPTVPDFLREQLRAAIKADDPDLAGELLDCLKCIGAGGGDDARAAERFLLSSQSAADGGWVCKGEVDLYSRYHASLVAVAALMDHSYAAHGPVFPRAADVLPGWFQSPRSAQPLRTSPEEEEEPVASGCSAVEPTEAPAPTATACRCPAWAGGCLCCLSGDGGGGSANAAVLCDVDHDHSEARRRAEEASRQCEDLVPVFPLPPQQKAAVALLPVMRRIHVREAVLADKRSQHRWGLIQEARAAAHRHYIQRVPEPELEPRPLQTPYRTPQLPTGRHRNGSASTAREQQPSITGRGRISGSLTAPELPSIARQPLAARLGHPPPVDDFGSAPSSTQLTRQQQRMELAKQVAKLPPAVRRRLTEKLIR